MKYLVVIEKGKSSWGAHVPDLPGCVAVGKTRDEAMELAREAVDLHVADLRSRGEPVPMPTSEAELVEAATA